MPEGFGQEYPLGGENVLKLHDALVCALEKIGTARDIVSRNTATRNENCCPLNFMIFAPRSSHLLKPKDLLLGSSNDSEPEIVV
jgi:hypothetical protein